MIGPLLKWTYHQLSNVERPPGGHCWNTYLRWVEALRFICGSGTRIFHLRMSGPQMGLGVSPIIRMPQWWSRQWPPWDAAPPPPIVRKLHYVLSHCVCMLFLFGWPPCQRSDVTLMEVSQHALHSLYIRSIWLLYIVMFFVNLIWYLYLFWLNKHCLSLSLSLDEWCYQKTKSHNTITWCYLLFMAIVTLLTLCPAYIILSDCA